jgi:hypothetical protein
VRFPLRHHCFLLTQASPGAQPLPL